MPGSTSCARAAGKRPGGAEPQSGRSLPGDLKRRLRGKSATKAQLLTEDREAFLPHPAGGLMRAGRFPPGPTRYRWPALTGTIILCPSPMRTTRFWSRLCGSSTAGPQQCVVASIGAPGARRGVFNYLHYLPLLSESPVRSIMLADGRSEPSGLL